jgi:hypothetical protein
VGRAIAAVASYHERIHRQRWSGGGSQAIRDELGLSPETPLEPNVADGHLELYVNREPAKLVNGPHGPSIAATARRSPMRT